jgi:opacity protein-like surface antigen
LRLLTTALVLAILLCVVGAAPASAAAILYDNGPLNGTIEGWTINFGYIVTDSFDLSAPGTVGGAQFGVWEFPGDNMTSVDWEITTAALGGTVLGSGTASTTQTTLGTNIYGYQLAYEMISFPGVSLGAGTYWFQLENGVVASGDPIFWDQNNGPSAAFENTLGSIGSESFQLYSTPEPASLGLIGMGLFGMAALLRRRINK